LSEYTVQTTKLTRKFGDFIAVNEVSIRVNKGEIFGFLGANGAGKTTMIRMLCGLLKPTSGKGEVAGFDIYQQTEQIKKNIGYMSQKFSLYNDLTINENIDFYGGIYGLDARQVARKKTDILEGLNLVPWQDKLTAELPPGFKQGLALATSMLHDPSVVFLDEPTSGVDPAARRGFWDLIHRAAASGTTIFVTTHYMDEAEYCNRVSIMSAGKIIALDTPQQLRKNYGKESIQEVFVSLMKKEIQQDTGITS